MTSQCLQAWVASERIASPVFWVSVSEHLVKIGGCSKFAKRQMPEKKSQRKVVGRE